MQQPPVSDLMRDCSSALIDESMILLEAAHRLLRQDVPVLLAVDADRRLVGMVTDSAIVRHLLTQPTADSTVSAVLSRHVESVRLDASLKTVLPMFRSACHCVIPVVDEDRTVVGLLHRSDIVPLLLGQSHPTDRESTASDELRLHRPHGSAPTSLPPQVASS